MVVMMLNYRGANWGIGVHQNALLAWTYRQGRSD